MKKLVLISSLFVLSPFGFAGISVDDLGFLASLPGEAELFNVGKSKTIINEYGSLKKLKIDVTGPREEFSWNRENKDSQKLLIERDPTNLNVKRITRSGDVSLRSSGSYNAHTTSFNPGGSVQSYTNCRSDYEKGFLGFKKGVTEYDCTTWNKKSCDYLKSNNVIQEFEQEIKSCGDMLSKLKKHQDTLKNLVAEDHLRDSEALRKVTGKKGQFKNFFEVGPETLANISEISKRLKDGDSDCKMLTKAGLFSEDSIQSSNAADNSKSSTKQ